MIFMNYFKKIIKILSIITDINYIYLYPFFMSLFILFISRIFLLTLKYILLYFNNKKSYILYKRINLFVNIFYIIVLFIIWESFINNIITLISFISATITLALKDIIFNYFAGIYIKVNKPFTIDDRVEVNGIKGDVIALNTFDFEVIEIGNYQSTGRIINIPNYIVLLEPIKNYNKNFKYIWEELIIKFNLNVDIPYTKKLLYEIINNNEIIKNINNKKNSIKSLTFNERLYFNKVSPYIYLKVVDSHIEFYIRYLVYPKNSRMVEDYFWTKVLELYNSNKLSLFIE